MASKPKPRQAPASTPSTADILNAINSLPAGGGAPASHPSIPAIGVPGAITTGPTGQPVYEGYQPITQPGTTAGYPRSQSQGGSRPVSDRPEYQQISKPPLYFEGDELRPATSSAEDIAVWQRQMAAAGLLTGQYRIGIWDGETAAAYKDVLAYANSRGTNDQTAMREMMAAPQQPKAKPPRAPLVVQLTNPADLKSLFEDAFQKHYGRKMRPDELGNFASDYQAQERAAQQQAYDLGGVEGTSPQGSVAGTVVAPPSPSTAAEQAAEAVNPTEAGAYDMLGTYQRALSFLSQPGMGAA